MGALAAVAMMVPLLGGVLGSGPVEAADEPTTANVTLNKLVWNSEDGEMPAEFINSGEVMTTEAIGNAEPLAGAGFTVYDVTAKFHELMATEKDEKAVMDQIQGDSLVAAPSYANEINGRAEIITGDNGEANFADLPLMIDGKDAVYLFLETTRPHSPTITVSAKPIVLAMPIYKVMTDDQGQPVLEDGKLQYKDELNTDIQLYPKNETAEDTKEFVNVEDFTEVTINGEAAANVTTGDVFNYRLTINVPANIGNKAEVTSYEISDTPSAGLAYQGNLVVTGLTKDTDYTVSEHTTTDGDEGFTITFKTDAEGEFTDAVKALAGQPLVITYDMELTAEAIPDVNHENKATIIVNNVPKTQITPPIPVVMGGKVFQKIDGQTKDSLAGAKFKVKNNAGEFGQFTLNAAGEYVFTQWGTEEDATEVVSAETTGLIKIKGLLYSDEEDSAITYTLVETEAPSDKYVVLKDEVDFTVAKNGYGEAENLVDIIANVPKGALPSTGGTGIFAFLAIGTALMLGAYLWFKNSKKQEV